MRVLLIDNIDSFTWNIVQLVRSLGAECIVRRADETIERDLEGELMDCIILSPGPGHPKDAHLSLEVIQKYSTSKPILGVCLGHQCFGYRDGGPEYIRHAPMPMHGKTSDVHHLGEGIFRSLPSPCRMARYHSLCVTKAPMNWKVTAWTKEKEEEVIMGMQHCSLPLFGVQFHPESFLSEHGRTLLKNFLDAQW